MNFHIHSSTSNQQPSISNLSWFCTTTWNVWNATTTSTKSIYDCHTCNGSNWSPCVSDIKDWSQSNSTAYSKFLRRRIWNSSGQLGQSSSGISFLIYTFKVEEKYFIWFKIFSTFSYIFLLLFHFSFFFSFLFCIFTSTIIICVDAIVI